MTKRIFFKTYDQTGTFKGFFTDFTFTAFDLNLNGGVSGLQVTVPAKFDDFGEGTSVDLGYELKIFVADQEAPSGVQIYSGEVDGIRATVGQDETVTLDCSGYIYQVALDILEDDKTVVFNFSSQDPSQTLKDIITQFRTTNSVAKINFTADSIDDTGKSESLRIFLNSPLDAIRAGAQLADANWNWFVDVDNLLYFKQNPTTPTHFFIMGKDISMLRINKNIQETRTGLLFTNGLTTEDAEQIFKLYSDSAAITEFGRRFDVRRDSRFKASTGSADEFGDRYVQGKKDPFDTVTLRILDSNLAGGYDIESIKPGDTCKVLNIGENSALTDNMLITTVTYNVDSVDLVVQDAFDYTERALLGRKQANNILAFSEEVPSSYTV